MPMPALMDLLICNPKSLIPILCFPMVPIITDRQRVLHSYDCKKNNLSILDFDDNKSHNEVINIIDSNRLMAERVRVSLAAQERAVTVISESSGILTYLLSSYLPGNLIDLNRSPKLTNTASIHASEQLTITAEQSDVGSKILLDMCAHITQIKLTAAVITMSSDKGRENNV